MAQHPHLFVQGGPDPQRFTSPNSHRPDGFGLPARDRSGHAGQLIQKLEAVSEIAVALDQAQREFGIDRERGIYITFESEPNFELKFESLDVTRSGIELCAVRTTQDNRTQATVFVPDGKLNYFLKRITAYRDENTPENDAGQSKPKNKELVESISDIRLSALEALWTEPGVAFPPVDDVRTWEVWLRREGRVDHLARLKGGAAAFNLEVGEQTVTFVDRKVVLVRGTASHLSRSIEILGMIAELRLPSTTAAFFTEMTANDQHAWVDELVGRIAPPEGDVPYVCLFDTGINHAHPIVGLAASAVDMHAYKPAWGNHDWANHGTPMAGLAFLGDFTEALASAGPIAVTHRLESVKIINAADPHEPELYGAVTQESAYRVEVSAERKRVFCMAVTATDGRDRGRPTSWSAAIDSLAAGDADDQRRLIVLSGGNTVSDQRHLYADSNMTDGIHDPAQAWNAVTVGGYTDKANLDVVKYPGWEPLAPKGDLSPCSCTSMTWRKWPIKPDIVMEAGNMGKNPAFPDPDYIDDGLQLLSASKDFAVGNPLTSFGDTSAATALAARYAALVLANYPSLQPETVRAMLIHSARWTPEMLGRFTNAQGHVDYHGLLRCFGHGVPNLSRLLSSLDNSLTLVVESELQPFFKDTEDAGRIKTREMRLHPLPWPVDVLAGLQNTPVTMKVTLSYFVEPSPGARGWTPKFGYQSHGLRFAVRKALENEQAFVQRVNRFDREDDYVAPGTGDPGWRFGHGQRSLTTLGSIHSDEWSGTAIDLASRGTIAVYPTMGWWNKRQHLNGWEKSTRYSLIVTISTPTVEADIYTAVANQIGVPVEIEV